MKIRIIENNPPPSFQETKAAKQPRAGPFIIRISSTKMNLVDLLPELGENQFSGFAL
jgi:hypothetical protein